MTSCIYCGKPSGRKDGICDECMGELKVLSGKFPKALSDRFDKHMEDNGYSTKNALLIEILNSYFGYGYSERVMPEGGCEAYERLLEILSLFPEYADVSSRVKEDYERFKLPDDIRNMLPLLREYPKEYTEILYMASNYPNELKKVVGLSDDMKILLRLFSHYPEEVRESLNTITLHLPLAEKLRGYLETGSLVQEESVGEVVPEETSDEPEVAEAVPDGTVTEPPVETDELMPIERKILSELGNRWKLPSEINVKEHASAERYSESEMADILTDMENRGLVTSQVFDDDFKTVRFRAGWSS